MASCSEDSKLKNEELRLENKEDSELTDEQSACVDELKVWVENQTEFKGSTDTELLTLFCHADDFDLEVVKKSVSEYYMKLVKYPQWWTNRNCEDPLILPFINTSVGTVLKEREGQPTIVIVHLGRFGADSSQYDSAVKTLTIGMDIVARRRSTKLHKLFLILNFDGCPWWLIMKLMWPSNNISLCDSTMLHFPLKYNKLVLVNASTWAGTLIGMITPLLKENAKEFVNMIHCSNDWSEIGEVVPVDLLPEEYGGLAGPLKEHEDAFIEEMMIYNDQLVMDNQYDPRT